MVVHNTSAHISWDGEKVTFFSGGENYTNFVALFDREQLTAKFQELVGIRRCTIYGEAYGGKQQRMAHTYGDKLKFITFDVAMGQLDAPTTMHWLDVPAAADFVKKFGLEFVDYTEIECTVEAMDRERDRPSTQAVRNGITEPKPREGVVLRPLQETEIHGTRVIAKHKIAQFGETKTPRTVDESKLRVLHIAQEIATEWVTENRMDHVLDRLGNPTELKMIPKVMEAMIEDVCREAKDEIADNPDTRKAIGVRAAMMYKGRVTKIPKTAEAPASDPTPPQA